MNKVLDEACECLTKAVEQTSNKNDFENAFSLCVGTFYKNAQQVDSSYNDVQKMNQLIHGTLKERCEKFEEINAVHENYVKQKDNDFLVKVEDCQILRSGIYMGVNKIVHWFI